VQKVFNREKFLQTVDTITSNSPEATMRIGAQVATELRGGEILALCGDLGAGKTHFVKGIVLGLGGEPQDVTSPTFTLVHEYQACRLPVFHFDFYRLEAESELRNIGWDDYLREDGVLLIEWAERFPDAFPKGTRFIQFEISSETERLLRFS
jgi:tRNA threonylcarbamoyladenosine biosynthesis protein TsaE